MVLQGVGSALRRVGQIQPGEIHPIGSDDRRCERGGVVFGRQCDRSGSERNTGNHNGFDYLVGSFFGDQKFCGTHGLLSLCDDGCVGWLSMLGKRRRSFRGVIAVSAQEPAKRGYSRHDNLLGVNMAPSGLRDIDDHDDRNGHDSQVRSG